MTSPISTRKLLKLEAKQNSWMFALSALVQFLAGPVYYLLAIDISLANQRDSSYILGRLCGFFDNGYFIIQLFAMIIAISFCIFSYRYLFSKRMVDLYHSVPITRGKLFWVKYIHGFLVWFLPFLASTVIVLVISIIRLSYYSTLLYTVHIITAWASSVALLFISYFIFYHLFLVAAYYSGNVLNLFANIAIIGGSIAGIYALVLNFAECYLDTFCQTPSQALLDLIMSLSPLITPFGMYYYLEGTGFVEFLTNHATMLYCSLLLCLLLLMLAIYLCCKRPSELAERGTISKAYRFTARIVVTFLATLAISLFFSQIVSHSFRILWGVFGAILGGILCFGTINSIYHTTIKSFFKNLPQMLGITAMGTLLILAFHLDWFGYDTYLPDKEDIAGMAIHFYLFGDGTSRILLEENSAWSYSNETISVTQENLLTDKDTCYHLLDLLVNRQDEESYRNLYVKIQLKNGHTYYRQYYINYSDYQALAPFIESDDYKHNNYKVSTGLMGYPKNVEISLHDANISFKLTGENAIALMDAYKADFEEHYNLEELSSYFYYINLELDFTNANGEYFYSYLNVPVTYERTISYLHDLYPEYVPYLVSPEQIVEITPYVSTNNLIKYGSVENYFAATEDIFSDDTQDDTNTVSSDPGYITIVESAQAYSPSDQEVKFTITEEELIAELYPLLYIGQYASVFELRDYIYFADIQTTDGRHVDAWVKPGTLPEKFIVMIEEAMAKSTK